jgi:hypothetical protein
MNQWSYPFRKLSLAEKATTAAVFFTSLSGIGFVISYIASTDKLQKIHIKHKLLSTKFPRPPHMDKVNFIYFKISCPVSILNRFCFLSYI